MTSTVSREQRITLCCEQLAPHVEAVDILHASCSKVRAAPDVERFRKVPLSAGGIFKDRVAPKPGATPLLYSLGYEPMHGHLVLNVYDEELMSHAIQQLEAAQLSKPYREAKASQLAERADAAARAKSEAESEAKRAAMRAKVPAEPSSAEDSSLCVITVHVDGQRVAKRNFEADNTLDDLHHFIRSLSPVPVDGKLSIQNVTVAPARPLDPEHQRGASLYSLDLWPVSHIAVEVAT